MNIEKGGQYTILSVRKKRRKNTSPQNRYQSNYLSGWPLTHTGCNIIEGINNYTNNWIIIYPKLSIRLHIAILIIMATTLLAQGPFTDRNGPYSIKQEVIITQSKGCVRGVRKSSSPWAYEASPGWLCIPLVVASNSCHKGSINSVALHHGRISRFHKHKSVSLSAGVLKPCHTCYAAWTCGDEMHPQLTNTLKFSQWDGWVMSKMTGFISVRWQVKDVTDASLTCSSLTFWSLMCEGWWADVTCYIYSFA